MNDEFDEARIESRRQLLVHIDQLFRPPASFYRQLEEAIALVARGRPQEPVEFERERLPAGELVKEFELEEFVEGMRDGSWTC